MPDGSDAILELIGSGQLTSAHIPDLAIANWASAVNARVAQAAAEPQRPFHVILTDIVMLHTSGTQLCDVVRRCPHTSRLPILALTGNANEVDALKLCGFDHVLSKPSSKSVLLEAIERALSAKR